MQTWFRYTLAFFGLVLLLTGFIYILGPQSTRQAAMDGQVPTGQLEADHTLTSKGEPQPSSDATSGTTSGTTSGAAKPAEGAPAPGTLKSNHGTDKAGNHEAAAAAASPTATPATKGAAPKAH